MISVSQKNVVLLLISLSSFQSYVLTDPIFVQVIFRHGQRNPEYAYPNDLYGNSSFWPEGWGQLTEEGKRQEYRLGTYLKQRYPNLLSSKYYPGEIKPISSDVDRTIMSLELVLAGLYPAGKDNWSNDIAWQPIPFRIIPRDRDNIIRMTRSCPRLDYLIEEFLNESDIVQRINKKQDKVFRDLEEYSGVKINSILDIDRVAANLIAQDKQGLKIPDWGTKLLNDEEFNYIYAFTFQLKSYTPEMKVLRCGPLLNLLKENFEERIYNSSSISGVSLLSGHDKTLIDIMNTLGVYQAHLPPYASAFILELHKRGSKDYYINLLYQNNTGNDEIGLHRLSLPGHSFNLTIQDFFQYIEKFIPENWNQACQMNQSSDNGAQSSHFYNFSACIILMSAIIVISIAVLSATSWWSRKKKHKRSSHNSWTYYTFPSSNDPQFPA